MIQQNDRPLIDFRQDGVAANFFAHAPISTSHCSDWNAIHVEYHHLPATDTGEHTLALHCICIALNSYRCDRWLDDRFYTDFCHSGGFGIIPAATAHRAASNSNSIEFVTLSFEPTLLHQVAQEWMNPAPLQLVPHTATHEDLLIQSIGLALKAEVESGCVGGRMYGETLANAIAVHLLRHYCNRTPQIQSYSTGLSPQKLQRVLSYIQDNLSQDLSLESIAAEVGISQYYFCHLFKQSIGISPWQYVIQQRIDRAKVLLRTSKLSISEVSLRCGFANQNHLSRHFQKLVNTTPKNYRNRI